MDLQILNDRIKELENELKDIRAKLEEAENEQQKSRRWKPQDEEAEFEAERLKVIAEMREFEESSENKWDTYNNHYCIYWSYIRNEISIDAYVDYKHDDIYFESKEMAEECIEKVGVDRLKRFYLRVED